MTSRVSFNCKFQMDFFLREEFSINPVGSLWLIDQRGGAENGARLKPRQHRKGTKSPILRKFARRHVRRDAGPLSDSPDNPDTPLRDIRCFPESC